MREKNMAMGNVPRCQHIKMNGTQCGSPALHWRRQCFFHERIRRERAKIAKDMSTQRRFDLPLLEDANSVQVALMKTIQMLGSGRLDHRTAGLMLYALQTASVNLRQANFEVRDPTEVVIQRNSVQCTSLGDSQWNEDDFQDPNEELEEDEENEAENETEGEIEEDETEEAETEEDETEEDEIEKQAPVAARSAQPAARKQPAPAKPMTLQETRMKVEGAVRTWLKENEREATVKPG
jgi:hypothetical protein